MKVNIPRWGVFITDVITVCISISLAYLLRFDLAFPDINIEKYHLVIPFVILVRIISFFIFKTYSGIVFYTSIQDAKRIVYAIGTGTIFFWLLNPVFKEIYGVYAMPYSIIILDFICSIFLLTSFRLVVKIMYLELINKNKEKLNVIIFGAGEAGIATKRSLDRELSNKYKIIGFIDLDSHLRKKSIEGVTIFNSDRDLTRILNTNHIDLFIFSEHNLPKGKKQDIVDKCLKAKVKVLNVPPMSNWINGELSVKQLKEFKIEDLLQRAPIELDKSSIKDQLQGKSILVTGGAGSIGSEIVRQVLHHNPKQLIIFDNAETPLHELQLELKSQFPNSNIEIGIGNINNIDRVEKVFNRFKPNIVFHAAAYKHVPMMENNPIEAFRTNVLGTQNLADTAVKYDVEKFVFISTDKAVNPTSVMGASKRLAEIYVQSLNQTTKKTSFITTRFGNVLGSNGSVIKLFKQQIEKGGPLTVTDKKITRYFMTIPEATQLVLEAGAMGKGGEIFVFDMGESVKINDLAKSMIELSGLELGKDIEISYTGLRPGEKLYEELLADQENTLATHHPQIMIGKVREYEFKEVKTKIKGIEKLVKEQNNDKMIAEIKELIPEYISNNSEFEILDSKKA